MSITEASLREHAKYLVGKGLCGSAEILEALAEELAPRRWSKLKDIPLGVEFRIENGEDPQRRYARLSHDRMVAWVNGRSEGFIVGGAVDIIGTPTYVEVV